jgi:hypothetical protein
LGALRRLQQEVGRNPKGDGLGMLAQGRLADRAGDLGDVIGAMAQLCQPLLKPRPFGGAADQATSQKAMKKGAVAEV